MRLENFYLISINNALRRLFIYIADRVNILKFKKVFTIKKYIYMANKYLFCNKKLLISNYWFFNCKSVLINNLYRFN